MCVRLLLYASGCVGVKWTLASPVDNARVTGDGLDGLHLFAHARGVVLAAAAQTSTAGSLHDPNMRVRDPVADSLWTAGCPLIADPRRVSP